MRRGGGLRINFTLVTRAFRFLPKKKVILGFNLHPCAQQPNVLATKPPCAKGLLNTYGRQRFHILAVNDQKQTNVGTSANI